jgi:hypothetical protein
MVPLAESANAACNPNVPCTPGTGIYWKDTGANTIGSANLDGSVASDDFISLTIANDPSGLAGVGLSPSGIYWANFQGIGSANLDGSEVNEKLVSGAIAFYPIVSGGHLYWGDPIDGFIDRANLDGTGMTTLASGVLGFSLLQAMGRSSISRTD